MEKKEYIKIKRAQGLCVFRVLLLKTVVFVEMSSGLVFLELDGPCATRRRAA